ncbi:MAG: DciA family protein [Undibacterium sp.]
MRALRDFIGKRGGDFHSAPLDDKTVFFLFRKIIREEYGARGSNELTPTEYSDGILSIKASNPLYSNELWMHRETLIDRMNQEFGDRAVKEMRLVRYERQ